MADAVPSPLCTNVRANEQMKVLFFLAIWWLCDQVAELIDAASYEMSQRLRRASRWADEKASRLQ